MTSTETTTPLHELFALWGADFLDVNGLSLPLRVSGVGGEYQAALESLALADGGDRGLVRMCGADLIDFLQRTLTSDLKKLQPDVGQWSALLDGKGRWLCELLLFRLPDQDGIPQLLLDCPLDCVASLIQRLDMMHFGESISWQELEVTRLMLLGPASQAKGFGIEAGPEADAFWLSRPDRGTACRELVGPTDLVRTFAEHAVADGAIPTGWVVLDILRVEAGRPLWRTDFDGDSILPETGEWQRASLAKGCYAGQEVVARIDTYGEAPRQLCLLDFDRVELPLQGAILHDDQDRPVGTVTSWVWSPRQAKAIGLGVIKRKALQDQQVLYAVSGQERVMTTWTRPVKGPDRKP
jgi:glycine cleavage system T protein (aminomethyltransferase)